MKHIVSTKRPNWAMKSNIILKTHSKIREICIAKTANLTNYTNFSPSHGEVGKCVSLQKNFKKSSSINLTTDIAKTANLTN